MTALGNAHRPITGHKTKAKSTIINTLLTLNVRSLWESLKPQPYNVDNTTMSWFQIFS